MSVKYSVVDVFTKERYTGNQLAIVEIPPSGLTQEQKQAIANEFHYSETTFVHPRETENSNTYKVDIFTVDQELPFAGHPIIGTAFYLLNTVAGNGSVTSGSFNLKAGRVKLEYDSTTQIAKAEIPHNIHVHKALCDSDALTELQPKLGRVPAQSPVVSIVTGMTFVLAELDSQDTLTFVNTTSQPLQV